MSRKLSFGRRLMLGASKFVSPASRWKLFRLPAGVTHLSDIDLPIFGPNQSPIGSTKGRTNIDVLNDRTVFRVDNGYTTHAGATLLPDGTLVRELSREWLTTPDGHCKLKKPTLLPKIHHHKRIASISIEHNSNYCHFFYDCLPRIPILRECGFADLPLYAPMALPFQREILDLMGYTPDRLIASVDQQIVQADELYIPCYDGIQGDFPAHVRTFIREELLTAARKRKPEVRFPRRLYISRNDSDSRRIVNEEALYAELKPLGFEFLVLAEMSIVDQILAFADAKCIVTPHGASLTNLVFGKPECALLEIFPPRLQAPFYQNLSRNMGMTAFEYRAKGIQIGNGDLAQNIEVPPDLIRIIVDQARISAES